jgi:hypothetical protein
MFDLHYFGNLSAGHNGTDARANRRGPGDFAEWKLFIVVFEQQWN